MFLPVNSILGGGGGNILRRDYFHVLNVCHTIKTPLAPLRLQSLCLHLKKTLVRCIRYTSSLVIVAILKI